MEGNLNGRSDPRVYNYSGYEWGPSVGVDCVSFFFLVSQLDFCAIVVGDIYIGYEGWMKSRLLFLNRLKYECFARPATGSNQDRS